MKWTGNKENQRIARKAISKPDGTTIDPVMSVGASRGSYFLSDYNADGWNPIRKSKSTNRQKPKRRK